MIHIAQLQALLPSALNGLNLRLHSVLPFLMQAASLGFEL